NRRLHVKTASPDGNGVSPAQQRRRSLATSTATAASAAAAAAADGSATDSPDTPDTPDSPETWRWPSAPVMALVHNLAPTWHDRGMAYFFSRYVSVDENACHQRFDFVYDVWKPVTLVPERQTDGVLASITAVGLLGIAHMTRSADMTAAARRAYCTAL